MHDHRKLEVWQFARRFVVDVYEVSADFPPDERYGLTSQLRRAAVSVVANLAEGAGRGAGGDFVRFVRYSAGSASECEALLTLSADVGLLAEADRATLGTAVERIRKMLRGLERSMSSGGGRVGPNG